MNSERSHHHKAEEDTDGGDDEASKIPHVHVQDSYPVYAATAGCQQSSY